MAIVQKRGGSKRCFRRCLYEGNRMGGCMNESGNTKFLNVLGELLPEQ